jgi:deoxycytidylate deaminase
MKASEESTYRIKVGAVLCRKGRAQITGTNCIKTHPIWANPDKHIKLSIHAEIDCLINSESEVLGDTIYVFRWGKKGIPGLARPCIDCIRELKKRGVNKIYYTTDHFPFWSYEEI